VNGERAGGTTTPVDTIFAFEGDKESRGYNGLDRASASTNEKKNYQTLMRQEGRGDEGNIRWSVKKAQGGGKGGDSWWHQDIIKETSS